MAVNRLKDIAERLHTFCGRLTLPQKVFLIGSLAAVMGSLIFVLYEVNKPTYALLYGNIPEQEMASIVEHLKQAKVPYRIEENRIFVPKERLYEARLSLAKAGIPKGSGVGFEIFDEQKLGSTEFVQKINYQRALQGELARTIAQLDKIEDARVHLALPEESLFVRDEKPPSAAVVIKLKRGQQLASSELQGIVHLVSGAVKGLTDERVTIMSTDGQILFKKEPGQTSFELSDLQLRYKQRLEEELQRKIQSMLGPVIGEGGVISRVTLDLDFNQIRVSEEMVDPDSAAPRSQQRIIEKMQGQSKKPKGNPDVPINVESKLLVSSPGKQEEGATGQSSEKQEEIINYELNKTVRQIAYAPGTIKRLSVAVLVDGPYREEGDKKAVKRVFVGRNPDELKAIEEIVKKAVGYNDARGDQVTVTNIPFAGEAPPVVPPVQKWLAVVKEYYRPLVNVILILMVFFLIVRPLMKHVGKIVVSEEEEVKKLPEKEEVAALPPTEETPRELSPRERAVIIAKEQPEKAAEIIRAWLREEVV